MSTELKTHPHNPVSMTKHSMGEGVVGVQLTHYNCDGERAWISISKEEALYLAHDLVSFGSGMEEDDE